MQIHPAATDDTSDNHSSRRVRGGGRAVSLDMRMARALPAYCEAISLLGYAFST
jgi:hypothetical protein